jgi:hypothetical protein
VVRPLHVRKPFALLLTAAATLSGWRLLLLLWPTALGGLRWLLRLRPAALGRWRLLLRLWPAALGRWRLLLLLWPTAFGGLRWLLRLRPTALGRWRLLLLLWPTAFGGLRWLLRLRPTALSPLLLLIGLTLLLLTLLLLIAACWSLTGRRFTSALTNGARGIVTEPTPLAGGEWLCWRYISAWLNDVLRFTHRYLSALSSSSSKILRAYFHRTLNLRASRQDARPHLKGCGVVVQLLLR